MLGGLPCSLTHDGQSLFFPFVVWLIHAEARWKVGTLAAAPAVRP